MSNMPSPEKRKVSLQLKIATIAKVDHVAKAGGFSRNEVVQTFLDRATKRVKLTPEELQAVLNEIDQNKESRHV